MMYYFKNIQEQYIYCVDSDRDFMITLFKDDKTAFIQYSWDRSYINRILDRYLLDDQYRPYFCDIKEKEFYEVFNSFHKFKIERDGNLSINVNQPKTK